MSTVSRRTALVTGACGMAARFRQRIDRAAALKQSVQDIRTISLQADRYHGWPTMIRRDNGELMVVCSGGRDSHVCPFGRVELIRSSDNGETWSFARTIVDGPIDDRDAGLVETSRGTLLATTFTSLAFEPNLQRQSAAAKNGESGMPDSQLARWQAAWRRLPNGTHASHLGCWMLRSEDGGTTWSPSYRVPVNSPHGPVNLSDGRLLYAGIALWTAERAVGIWLSDDDGRTWAQQAQLPTREGDDSSAYHELHAVEAASGRWIVHIRNHNKANHRETLQTHSDDGGRTWTTPYSIGVWGLPSHLLRLSDDRLLMTYGHRRQPLGNQARVSEDHGATWSDPVLLQGDATSGDLGYPSTVELSPGRLATVWYEKLKGSKFAQLRMARWKLQ